MLYLFTFKTELNGCGQVLYTVFWHHVWNTRIYKHQTKAKLLFDDVMLEEFSQLICSEQNKQPISNNHYNLLNWLPNFEMLI